MKTQPQGAQGSLKIDDRLTRNGATFDPRSSGSLSV